MKYLKRFESEIYIGMANHYNALKPVNQKIFEPSETFSFHCNDCGFDFSTYEKEQDYCKVCLSKNIETSK